MRAQEEPLRVLYLDHLPRYEYRFLKNALIRDRTLRVHVLLTSADKEWEHPASEGLKPLTMESAVPLLCDADKLAGYDAVLWGDLHPDRLTPERKKQEEIESTLCDFVESGKGILFIGGANYAHKGNPGHILSDLLPAEIPPPEPVEIDEELKKEIEALIEKLDADEMEERESAVQKLVEIGKPAASRLRKAARSENAEVRTRAREALRRISLEKIYVEETAIRRVEKEKDHPALKVEDRTIWSRAPKIRWWIPGAKPRKGSRTLVETAKGDPILVVASRGKGRTALLATDEWWLWRRGRGNRDYYPLYRSVLKWLAGK